MIDFCYFCAYCDWENFLVGIILCDFVDFGKEIDLFLVLKDLAPAR